MSDLTTNVAQSILDRRLFRRGESILAAVSGGVDSVVLLHLLAALAKTEKWKLTVAHFNHQLRGRASDADERFVKNIAVKLGLPFVAGRADVRQRSRDSKTSLEMAARRLRHEFLARTAAERKIRKIALAHHADDQVELFFLRLLRGAGGGGLAGMKWQNPSFADRKILPTRPLLDQPKSALLSYARQHGLRFREDATNAHHDIPRNRLRHELLPQLEKIQPALGKVILRQMEIFAAEKEMLDQAFASWLEDPAKPLFSNLPLALQRYFLQAQLAGRGITPNFDVVEQLRQHADRKTSADCGISLLRDRAGKIQILETAKTEFDQAETPVPLDAPAGSICSGHLQINWAITPHSGGFRLAQKRPNCEIFDADKVGGQIILRHWRPGDRFQPSGMEQPAKLQDLFTNLKVPRDKRRQLLVATTASGELFWVEGLRLAEPFKLDKSTRRGLKWEWNPLY